VQTYQKAIYSDISHSLTFQLNNTNGIVLKLEYDSSSRNVREFSEQNSIMILLKDKSILSYKITIKINPRKSSGLGIGGSITNINYFEVLISKKIY